MRDELFQTRTESLVKVGVRLAVEPSLLREPNATDMVASRLRQELDRTLEKLGRLPVEDVRVKVDQDPEHDVLLYAATVLTRESDQGSWPEIWQAIHEDEADRRSGVHDDVD